MFWLAWEFPVHCQREVPTAGVGAACFPSFPTPHVHLAGRVSAFSTTPSTQPGPSPHWPDLTASVDSTTPVGWFQSKGPALWAALWHVDLWRPPTHGLVMDVAHSSHSQPASQRTRQWAEEGGREERGEGRMKQALYLSCPHHLGLNPRSLAVLVSPFALSLFLSRFTSVRPSWCLARHPSPSPSPAGPWRETKRTRDKRPPPAVGRPRCVTSR